MKDAPEMDAQGRGAGKGRIMSRKAFLHQLDLEVKRAQRYQNFFSILIVKLVQLRGHEGRDLRSCSRTLAQWFEEEARESDFLGSWQEGRLLALLPYADLATSHQAKSRFEGALRYYDFKKEGVEVVIEPVLAVPS